jgi:hypothetical protein
MENEIDNFKEKITPESAQKMLRDEGMDVTIAEAKEILYFLRKIANIAVLKYLEKNENS